jgi:heme/copper-type cytochrome/quinol oxidase subunit 2
MADQNTETDWEYRTLQIFWAMFLAVPFLFMLCLYLINDHALPIDHSQPLIGKHYIVIPVAIFLALLDLFLAYYRHRSYLRQAVADKNPELVQTALIIAGAKTISIALYGLVLAWFFEYPYFYIWFLVSVVATAFYYPRRSALAAARP